MNKNIGTNTGPLLIRNDYLRFLYTSMLLEFSFEDMREFWSMHQLKIDDRILSDIEFFDYIWNPENKTDFNFVTLILDSIEKFFLSKQKFIAPFLNNYLGNTTKGTPLGPQIALWAIYPVLKFLFNAKDVETIFLKNLHIINERVRPGTFQKLIKIHQRDNKKCADVVFSPDPTFKNKLHFIDGELFFTKTLQMAISRFGLTPFHSYEMISECQNLQSRLHGFVSWEVKGEEIIVDGKLCGKTMWFSEFLKLRELNIASLIDCPNKRVEVITKKYFCKKRNRIILHENCAYGAPVYLYRMFYAPKINNKGILDKLFHQVSYGIAFETTKINNLHKDFIASLSSPIFIKYNKSNEYIFVNDKYFTQGKQATILFYILDAYRKDGRVVFEHKEFIKDDRFISSEKQPGFVPRLNRVADLLTKSCPQISLTKSSRGKFILKTTAPINLQVIEKQ